MIIGIFVLLAFQAIGQDQTGSIEGTVVDSVSHMPVKKAQVIASPASFVPQAPRPGEAPQPPKPRQVLTDASGAFSIPGLAPGRYIIQVSQPTYPFTGNYQNVEVKAGDPARIDRKSVV